MLLTSSLQIKVHQGYPKICIGIQGALNLSAVKVEVKKLLACGVQVRTGRKQLGIVNVASKPKRSYFFQTSKFDI